MSLPLSDSNYSDCLADIPQGQLRAALTRIFLDANLRTHALGEGNGATNGFCPSLEGKRLDTGVLDNETLKRAVRHGVLQLLPLRYAPGPIANVRRLHAVRFSAQRKTLSTIQTLFAKHSVSCTVVKGVSLNDRLYGSNWERCSQDVDLVVPALRQIDCIKLLVAEGFTVSKKCTSLALLVWANKGTWMSEGISLQRNYEFVDLHIQPNEWGPEDVTTIHSSLGDGSAISYQTLTDARLLVYLCTHARKHLWAKLQWIFDIALLLAAISEENAARAVELARREGSLVSLTVSARLARHLFELQLPPALENALFQAGSSERVASRISSLMFDTDDSIVRKTKNVLLHLQCEDSLRRRVRFFTCKFLSPTYSDIARVQLPFYLRYYYVLFRPLRIMYDICSSCISSRITSEFR